MNDKAIASKNMTKAAIFILDRATEIFQVKYTQEGKLAVKQIRHCLDKYLRSASDHQKLSDLFHALIKAIPLLTQEAAKKVTEYLKTSNKRTS